MSAASIRGPTRARLGLPAIRATEQPKHHQELYQHAVVSATSYYPYPCGYEWLENGDRQCRRDTEPDPATSSRSQPAAACLI